MKKREITLPTIVGVFMAVLGLVSGLWLLRSRLGQTARADVEEVPNDVEVINVGNTSFTVSWLTQKATAGFVQYGEKTGQPDLVVSDERDQQKGAIENYLTHYVTVRGLKPSTEYGFRIGSGAVTYDQEGEVYAVTTAPSLGTTPPADVAYGRVVTGNAEPAEGAVVHLTMPGVAPLGALVKATGSWVIPLSTARSEDLSAYAGYDKEATEMDIFVQGGPLGTASVTLTTQNDNPVPDITLGETYDLRERGDEPVLEGGGESKFSADSLGPATEAVGGEELVLVAPKFGEKVNSQKPEIIGEAPPGTEITIKIESEPITGRVMAGTDGRFSFSVPSDLGPGEHTVTITAIIDGITQQVARSFTVYAVGESSLPAFSATPSATLAPTAGPSPTARPTATPTQTPIGGAPSPTPKPTATPTPTRTPTPTLAVATDSGIPIVGVETPTILVLGLGFGLVLAGGWWYGRA